jgi:hypothetical protein
LNDGGAPLEAETSADDAHEPFHDADGADLAAGIVCRAPARRSHARTDDGRTPRPLTHSGETTCAPASRRAARTFRARPTAPRVRAVAGRSHAPFRFVVRRVRATETPARRRPQSASTRTSGEAPRPTDERATPWVRARDGSLRALSISIDTSTARHRACAVGRARTPDARHSDRAARETRDAPPRQRQRPERRRRK